MLSKLGASNILAAKPDNYMKNREPRDNGYLLFEHKVVTMGFMRFGKILI